MPNPDPAQLFTDALSSPVVTTLRKKTCLDALKMCQNNHEIFVMAEPRATLLVVSQCFGLAEAIVSILAAVQEGSKSQLRADGLPADLADKASDVMHNVLCKTIAGLIRSG